MFAAIANYGPHGLPLTTRAACAVAVQSGRFDLSVTVVDDGSGPAVVEAIRKALPEGVNVIAMPENRGYAAACNEAIRRARGRAAEFVWLLNNDVDMPESTLALLLETLERHHDWAAVAPVTIDPRPPYPVLGAGVTVGRVRARVRHISVGQPQSQLPSEPYEVEAIEGAAPLIRVAALEVVGGLEESYRMYWEDTDWSVRARGAGWRIGIDPRARVSHLVAQSTPTKARTELLIANRIRFSDRIGTPAQRVLFRAYFILGWLPLYALTRLVPRFGVRPGTRMAGRLLSRALHWTPSPGGEG